ncbi:MAG: MazG family protein [Mobilicoccus sp.]|nr:MazG family protein [Mobilicoccus sp.]
MSSLDPVEQRGRAVLDLVAVMDRLRSPGGCPWDAEQTHASLAPYAVEEAYELSEAILTGERGDLVDELGDVLFQVVFHARVGEEGEEPFDIDDVARGIIAKLQRRHPHVFDGLAVSGTGEIEDNWDAIKAAEKPDRTGPLDGIPAGMPPLERATKVTSRLRRAGVDLPAAGASGDGIGDRMLDLVREASDAGLDPASELRAALTRWEGSLSVSPPRGFTA